MPLLKMTPGATALTSTPRVTALRDIHFTSACTAPLDAE